MDEKSLMVLQGEIKTPRMSEAARREAGFLLRRLQQGENLALPHSRPMPDIGPRCQRVADQRREQDLAGDLSDR